MKVYNLYFRLHYTLSSNGVFCANIKVLCETSEAAAPRWRSILPTCRCPWRHSCCWPCARKMGHQVEAPLWYIVLHSIAEVEAENLERRRADTTPFQETLSFVRYGLETWTDVATNLKNILGCALPTLSRRASSRTLVCCRVWTSNLANDDWSQGQYPQYLNHKTTLKNGRAGQRIEGRRLTRRRNAKR